MLFHVVDPLHGSFGGEGVDSLSTHIIHQVDEIWKWELST